MSKKVILIDALEGEKWIGGLYYRKNILYSMLQSDYLQRKFKIIVAVNQKYKMLFQEFEDQITLLTFPAEKRRLNNIFLSMLILLYRVKYVFPCGGENHFLDIGAEKIYWIPDFQDCYYPDFFPKEDLLARKNKAMSILNSENALVVSSNSAKNDYETFYGAKKELFVIPFISCIEQDIRKINVDFEISVIKKYQLRSKRYALVCNQFWQHKNHIVVLKAIKRLIEKTSLNDFKFVFTGKLQDSRNIEYCKMIENLLNSFDLKGKIIVTGFIKREEQLALMKNCDFIIQPSLFEGWGTVLEDAKVLDQRVILSDIPVHQEQIYEKCELFDPYSEEELSGKIEKFMKCSTECNVEYGIRRMKKSAMEYSGNIDKLFKYLEERK